MECDPWGRGIKIYEESSGAVMVLQEHGPFWEGSWMDVCDIAMGTAWPSSSDAVHIKYSWWGTNVTFARYAATSLNSNSAGIKACGSRCGDNTRSSAQSHVSQTGHRMDSYPQIAIVALPSTRMNSSIKSVESYQKPKTKGPNRITSSQATAEQQTTMRLVTVPDPRLNRPLVTEPAYHHFSQNG